VAALAVSTIEHEVILHSQTLPFVGTHGSTLEQTALLYVCRDSTQSVQDTGGVPASAARISTAGQLSPTLEPQQHGRAHIVPIAAAGSEVGQLAAPERPGSDSACSRADAALGSSGGVESSSAGGLRLPMPAGLPSQLSTISVQAASMQQQQQHRPRSALVEEL
jgi:hypothetical protein